MPNYLSHNEIQIFDGTPYVRVEIPDDSNCGPNSVALWWISQIRRDVSSFPAEILEKLKIAAQRQHIIKAFTDKLNLYKNTDKYSGWARPFEALQQIFLSNEIDTITANSASFTAFIKKYQTLQEIGALHVALGILLKDVAVKLQEDELIRQAAADLSLSKSVETIVQQQRQEAYSDPDLLTVLSNALGANLENLTRPDKDSELKRLYSPHQNTPSQITNLDDPQITLLFKPDSKRGCTGPESHWDLLLPYTEAVQAFPEIAQQSINKKAGSVKNQLATVEIQQFQKMLPASLNNTDVSTWIDELNQRLAVLTTSSKTSNELDEILAINLQLDEIDIALKTCKNISTAGLHKQGVFASKPTATKVANTTAAPGLTSTATAISAH